MSMSPSSSGPRTNQSKKKKNSDKASGKLLSTLHSEDEDMLL
jgi:hypothetical protein